jgi:hypothetical protein
MPAKMMTLAMLCFVGLLAWAPSVSASDMGAAPPALEAALNAATPVPASEAALDAELNLLLHGSRESAPSYTCPAWKFCFTTFQCAGVCLFGGICLANCCYCR